jgi:hypothetical protein
LLLGCWRGGGNIRATGQSAGDEKGNEKVLRHEAKSPLKNGFNLATKAKIPEVNFCKNM